MARYTLVLETTRAGQPLSVRRLCALRLVGARHGREKQPDRLSMEVWDLENNCIAAMDEAWMAQACADFLFSLERRGWTLVP